MRRGEACLAHIPVPCKIVIMILIENKNMDVPDEQDLRLTLAKPSQFAKRTQNTALRAERKEERGKRKEERIGTMVGASRQSSVVSGLIPAPCTSSCSSML